MNAAIQRVFTPAVPGDAPLRLRDKAEAVDTQSSFAAALDTFAESLAAMSTPVEDAPAHRGKAAQHGKLPQARDEPASEALAMMLAAAAVPLVPARAPALAEGANVHEVLSVGRPKQAITQSADPVAPLAAMPRTGAAVPAGADAAQLPEDTSPSDAGRLASPAARAVPFANLARSRDLIPARAAASTSSDTVIAAPVLSVPSAPAQTTDRAAGPGLTAGAEPSPGAFAASEARHTTRSDASPAAAAAPDGPLAAAQLQVQERTALASRTAGRQAEEASADAPAPLESLPGLATPGAHTFVHAAPQSAPVQVGAAVGSIDWGEVLGQHLVRLASTGRREVELNLNPTELGPLRVSLSLTNSHAQIAFVSEHPAVRAALEAALPQLRTAFADSGISLGQTSVGSGSGEPRPENGPGGNHRPNQAEPARLESTPPNPPRSAAVGQDPGSGIDTFA